MNIFIARQPIFDKDLNVIGYELLYRGSKENKFNNIDGDEATLSVLINSFIKMDFKTLTNEKKSFINFTEKLIKDKVVNMFPKDQIVVEILEDVIPDQELISACKDLKERGYTLALDDFVLENMNVYNSILDLIDIIKVDFVLSSPTERAMIAQKISNTNIKLLAEKVETRQELNEAIEMGYDLFQGYFFSKPQIFSAKDIPIQVYNYNQILSEINKNEYDFKKICEMIARDISLSYYIIKLMNSPLFYRGTRITSIQDAVVRLGQNDLKKWIYIIMLKDINKSDTDEIIRTVLIRAYLAEKISKEINQDARKEEFFLTGLFSMIDILLNRPLKEILSELNLSRDVENALLGEKNIFNDVLKLIISYEKADWNETIKYSNQLNIKKDKLYDLYFETLELVNSISNT